VIVCHLKVGAAHARRRVLAIVGEQEVTIVARRDPSAQEQQVGAAPADR